MAEEVEDEGVGYSKAALSSLYSVRNTRTAEGVAAEEDCLRRLCKSRALSPLATHLFEPGPHLHLQPGHIETSAPLDF